MNLQNQATSLNVRSGSYPAVSDDCSGRGNLNGSRTSSASNKGKRLKRDDLESQSQSSKKRAGPLQDITNNMSRGVSVSAFQAGHQGATSSRVTRSMTSSDRKSKKVTRDATAMNCDTVVKTDQAKKEEAKPNAACSASTTRKISQSFAQASINEQEAFKAHSQAPGLVQSTSGAVMRNGEMSLAPIPLERTRQRLWKDIDAPLKGDMRMCTDYVNDVYTNAQIKQLKHSPNPDYMELHQREITITMRGILVDWLVEVAVEYNQSQETLFLSVGYIDAYLSKARCVRSKLQLVGITCMHIASKYQEIYPPQLNEFCYITDNTYEREELIGMERRILDVLDFELSIPTTWMFLMRFLRVAEATSTTEYFGMYLAELSLLEYGLLQFLPSQIAASAVMLALHNNRQPHWSTTLEHYTGYTPRALRECALVLHKVWSTTRDSSRERERLPAIGEKYAKEKTGAVSHAPVRDLDISLFDQPY